MEDDEGKEVSCEGGSGRYPVEVVMGGILWRW